ncbi:hypothetical protein SteCoe_33405 [Stentor coeruleus]|uniref:Uncharacterized protein n=1 Tax=Stentor coeruleus TaxID=5963 RepID=A0A1R2AWW5_9CILI|nr:hypothetical protein SteCoe_33405 [Stentor coeruleus]
MGAKKRSEGGKMATDDSADQLYRAYRRNLTEMGLQMPKKLEEKFLEIRDEKNPGFLTEVVFWEYMGPDAIRALADALRDTSYPHLRTIRCWRAGAEDEGTRSLTQYMRICISIVTLELMECGISYLGCDFLGRLLSPENSNPLLVLKLDHNDIGNQGVYNLAKGLCMNSVLKTLTLSYCNFDHEAARAIMQILIFQESALQDLDLQGNKLSSEGCCKVFHGLKVNQTLGKLVLADNVVTSNDVFEDKLIEMLTVNQVLCVLDLRLNFIFDDTAKELLDRMKNAATGRINSTIYEIIFPEDKVAQDTVEDYHKFLQINKKSKKGKKKAKKPKK